MEREYALMREKNEMLENELQVVQCYLNVLEQGLDTKKIVKEFDKLQKNHKKVKEANYKLRKKNTSLTEQLDEALKQLKRQQESIVKPLIAECSKRELEIQRLQEEVKSRTKNLKILFAITKSPKMSDLVYKAERKRFT